MTTQKAWAIVDKKTRNIWFARDYMDANDIYSTKKSALHWRKLRGKEQTESVVPITITFNLK